MTQAPRRSADDARTALACHGAGNTAAPGTTDRLASATRRGADAAHRVIRAECVALTRAMTLSGAVLDWRDAGLHGPVSGPEVAGHPVAGSRR